MDGESLPHPAFDVNCREYRAAHQHQIKHLGFLTKRSLAAMTGDVSAVQVDANPRPHLLRASLLNCAAETANAQGSRLSALSLSALHR
jgi:hypothetical protein